MISTMLAEMLAVKPGDSITVEVLEGRRPTVEIPVAGVFERISGRRPTWRSTPSRGC